MPIAILDGGPITAQRTAAVSGVAIRRYAPWADRPLRAALIGAGTQARSHVPILGHGLRGIGERLGQLFDDQPAGAVDRNWNVENSFVPYPGTVGYGGTVYAVAEQPNGSAIIAGSTDRIALHSERWAMSRTTSTDASARARLASAQAERDRARRTAEDRRARAETIVSDCRARGIKF